MIGHRNEANEYALSVLPEISIIDVNEHNMQQLQQLHSVLFPIRYPEKFYKAYAEGLYRLVQYKGQIVGCFCCRFEVSTDGNLNDCYLMTFGVLAAYRRLGIGAAMLTHLLNILKNHYCIGFIKLHVQSSNHVALKFYRRLGFTDICFVPDYYRKITPSSAILLARKISVHSLYNNVDKV